MTSSYPFVKLGILPLSFAVFLVPSFSAETTDPVSESMTGFEEAIRLQTQLSDEKRDWNRQRDILTAEIKMLEAQLEESLERVRSIEAERTSIQEQRQELVEDLATERKTAAHLQSVMDSTEDQFRSLLTALPPWFNGSTPRIDVDSETIDPVELFRALRSIQIENERISVSSGEVSPVDSNLDYRVDLLSFGLGGAFFSSADGSFGGRYVFDGEMWQVEDISQFAGEIRSAILQTNGLVAPEILLLPVSVSGNP
ncbi:MAG: DUF3450 family protein [Verrucomicrobiota bacterium]